MYSIFFMGSGYIDLKMARNMGRNQLTYEHNRVMHDVTHFNIFIRH